MARMTLDFEDGIALLKFNHPEVMNAVGSEMLGDFRSAVEEIKINAGRARCVLLTGEGRSFCAGANLQDDSKGNEPKEAGSSLSSRIGYADRDGGQRRCCWGWYEFCVDGRHRLCL